MAGAGPAILIIQLISKETSEFMQIRQFQGVARITWPWLAGAHSENFNAFESLLNQTPLNAAANYKQNGKFDKITERNARKWK